MMNIKLGDKVRCKITGFEGTAVVRLEFINGCVQYDVVPKKDKDGKYPENIAIDETSLEVIPTKKPKIKKKETGGAVTRGVSLRGF